MTQHSGFGLSTIGQISVTVKELDRAVTFYRDQLGIQFLFRVPNMAFCRDSEMNILALMAERPHDEQPQMRC